MPGPLVYRERLSVPLRWWVQATMGVISAFLAVVVALPPWGAMTVAVLVAGVVYGSMVWFGSAVVEVHAGGPDDPHGRLRAGRAQVPVTFVAGAEALDRDRTRTVAGREADARAFLLLRGFLSQSVRVRLEDPRDPTPYWLISTRHPEELVAAIRRARQTDGAAGSHGASPFG